MAKLALVVLLLLAVAACASASIDMDLGFLSTTGGSGAGRRECRGTVAECLAEEDEGEYELGSASAESHRRALYRAGYISYGALRRDNVPCSRRGASYYNCRPGAQANPYHRGCSRITRCRN
ncbi:Protein RALF-like 33 [Dichanthelium oligosanthes]|uniref:Protein RALF-like 33 n=1 Tax=Dichanthelium oligosanthes TaxID=888268 RepID=A0A1E5UZX1_9POAL|nr:Protein RALF-like 33 [Dichanthelium oligosanthes]